jgi:hypothetical protein
MRNKLYLMKSKVRGIKVKENKVKQERETAGQR